MAKQRIYKIDNAKALLIFLVVVGHLTTSYVSDYHSIRWLTLWIYSFHMPAFIFISGLVRKKCDVFRLDKVIGYLACAYALKIVVYLTKILLGLNPTWHWLEEATVPWYLVVLAWYEIIFYVFRKANPKIFVIVSFLVSALIGYIELGDFFALSRAINFLPIYALGYYSQPQKTVDFLEKRKTPALIIVIISICVCYFGKWSLYGYRKWFTGRRSYYFMGDIHKYYFTYGWAFRLIIWAIAIVLALSVIALVPNKQMKYISALGSKTMQVYFWHRSICTIICYLGVYPALVSIMGSPLATCVYVLIGAAVTAFLCIDIFKHPGNDLLSLGTKILSKKEKK